MLGAWSPTTAERLLDLADSDYKETMEELRREAWMKRIPKWSEKFPEELIRLMGKEWTESCMIRDVDSWLDILRFRGGILTMVERAVSSASNARHYPLDLTVPLQLRQISPQTP